MNIIEQENNEFGIIYKNEAGEIKQIGLTESQYVLFKSFLAALSSDSALIQLPGEYDLLNKEVLTNKVLFNQFKESLSKDSFHHQYQQIPPPTHI